MDHLFRRFLPCCFLLLASLSSQAKSGLSFDQQSTEIKVKADALTTTVPFKFENKSQEAVTIARWDSACSCLNARIKDGKMTYQPGDKGLILIDFELGSFSGVQEKTVMLWTKDDSPEKPSIILTVKIHIPVLFEISPKTLFWDQNGSKEAKVISIKVNHDQPIHIANHSGTNESFPYTLKTVKEGKEYELIVTPSGVSSPAFGLIKLTTDAKIKRYQRQQAFVCVRRAK
ncbi:DUF1573 domain-containing protein [Verrucomicrobiaceae bacterium 5K15]|uniref:DUF1573 domain-containing protein n=1 Tax=Oceaniferula flava TaxID=2800421 RepID=A0AAE2SFK1_9BACT|nr:DUF1573 domain-containing protein [Oceaniferula flavus]MBK1855655.1 DUF1573 domain-containing protein [Oceaniferula flavus]MBM1136961.1 DUF1573 domain-containing protein [Oceaniferula flavus]